MGTSQLRRLLAAAPVFLALAGCSLRSSPSPAAAPDASLLSDRPPAHRLRGCRVDQVPAELPAPQALVDTAALARAVAELRRGAEVPPGYVLLSMGYAPDGANIRRALIEHTVPQALADSLQKLVFAHRRTLPPESRQWGVRLRIDLGATLGLQVGRREICPPRPRNRTTLSFTGWSPRAAVDPYQTEMLAGGYTVWVRLRLNELGQVMDARLERGLLRRGISETLLLDQIRAVDFFPAVEDGRPIPSEITVPVRVPL